MTVLLEDRDLEWEAEFRAADDLECAVSNCSETIRGVIPLSTRSMNDARRVCSRTAVEGMTVTTCTFVNGKR